MELYGERIAFDALSKFQRRSSEMGSLGALMLQIATAQPGTPWRVSVLLATRAGFRTGGGSSALCGV